ncbi:30S ribosomal protein S6 [Thermodesulfobacteriota bacterium]
MRHYELIYIVNPNLNDEDFHELVKKYSGIIENLKGIIIKTQEWGKQRLAYRIRKFYNGVYVYVDFCAENKSIAELERNLKLDDNILKFQTVKLADQANPEELLEKEKPPEDDSVEESSQETEESAADQESQENVESKEESEE